MSEQYRRKWHIEQNLWEDRLQILAKPVEFQDIYKGENFALQKALHLLFDEHRQNLGRSNDAEFWRNRIAELSAQISKLQSELLATIKKENDADFWRNQIVELSAQTSKLQSELLAVNKKEEAPVSRVSFFDRLGRFVQPK